MKKVKATKIKGVLKSKPVQNIKKLDFDAMFKRIKALPNVRLNDIPSSWLLPSVDWR